MTRGTKCTITRYRWDVRCSLLGSTRTISVCALLQGHKMYALALGRAALGSAIVAATALRLVIRIIAFSDSA